MKRLKKSLKRPKKDFKQLPSSYLTDQLSLELHPIANVSAKFREMIPALPSAASSGFEQSESNGYSFNASLSLDTTASPMAGNGANTVLSEKYWNCLCPFLCWQ